MLCGSTNLLWRLLWGFVGDPFARWHALLPGGRGFGGRLAAFVRGTLAGKAPFYMGHNPVARVFLTLLVTLLIVQAGTGLVLAGTDVYMPPLECATGSRATRTTPLPSGRTRRKR